jgi:hypothetical protein
LKPGIGSQSVFLWLLYFSSRLVYAGSLFYLAICRRFGYIRRSLWCCKHSTNYSICLCKAQWFFRRIGLSILKAKSELVLFSRKHANPPIYESLNGRFMPVVPNFRFSRVRMLDGWQGSWSEGRMGRYTCSILPLVSLVPLFKRFNSNRCVITSINRITIAWGAILEKLTLRRTSCASAWETMRQ